MDFSDDKVFPRNLPTRANVQGDVPSKIRELGTETLEEYLERRKAIDSSERSGGEGRGVDLRADL